MDRQLGGEMYVSITFLALLLTCLSFHGELSFYEGE